MSTKIDTNAARALLTGARFRDKATEVRPGCRPGRWVMDLHGNTIAHVTPEKMALTLCGWNTITTRNRLNAILAMRDSPWRFAQHQGRAVLRRIDRPNWHRIIGKDAVVHLHRGDGELDDVDEPSLPAAAE